MRAPKMPLPGPGRFQWNLGGLCGASIGGTAWMLPTAGILIANHQGTLALLPIACFLFVNAIAAVLWMRRDRLQPFRAYMVLLGVLTVLTPIVWISVSNGGTPDALEHMNWPDSPAASIVAVTIAPALALYFWYLESAHRTHSESPQ